MAFSLNNLLPKNLRRDRPIVPVLRLSGAIGMNMPLRPGLSLASLEASLAGMWQSPNRRRREA